MSEKLKRVLGIIIFVAFSFCLMIGSNTDEPNIVFQKASQICMECIGIG